MIMQGCCLPHRSHANISPTITNRRWKDKTKADTVRVVAAEAALAAGDAISALMDIKAAAARWPHSRVVWSLFAR